MEFEVGESVVVNVTGRVKSAHTCPSGYTEYVVEGKDGTLFVFKTDHMTKEVDSTNEDA